MRAAAESARYKLKFYEPEEELGENYQDHNCAYANSTGAIWTLSVFTQFLLRFIASQVMGRVNRRVTHRLLKQLV